MHSMVLHHERANSGSADYLTLNSWCGLQNSQALHDICSVKNLLLHVTVSTVVSLYCTDNEQLYCNTSVRPQFIGHLVVVQLAIELE